MKLQFSFLKPARFVFSGTNIFRSSSFKVLHKEIQCEDFVQETALKVSREAENVINVLNDFSLAGGGARGIHRHTVINKKLLVRDRLKLLFDNDSPFLEIGLLSGIAMDYGNIPAAGSVAGIGKIHGRYCLVGANDATVKAGTFFPISIKKQIRVQQLSYLNRLPCIYLVDSGGAFLPLQAEIFPDRDHGGRTFYNEAVLSSLGIPQVALVCGSSTAGGAYCPTMAEEAIIVKRSGIIFLAGPPLVKAATGEVVSEQDLGGAELHCSTSGCTDYFAETEEEAFQQCRESVLTFNTPQASRNSAFEEPLYNCEDLSLIAGKEIITKEDMYLILSRILDGSMFKEFKGKFGKHLITGFGFIHGILVGLLANSNSLTFQDAQKGCHFIQLCEKRRIPLIFLQNSGTFSADEENSNDSVLRDRAKMVSAHSCSEVPKIVLCVGGCFADDNFTMCGWAFNPNFFFTWPLVHIGPERIKRNEMFQKQKKLLGGLSNSKDISDYEILFENSTSAFHQTSRMSSDGIILPQDTRKVLALCVDISLNKFYTPSYLKETGAPILRM